MKTAASIARILLGVIFVVFGLNGFLHFLPQPAMPPAAGAFFGALAATGYMLPLIFATQLVGGTLLLLGLVPLGVLVLAPVISRATRHRRSPDRTYSGSRPSAWQMRTNENGHDVSVDANHRSVSA
jgi:hypothetical protein